VTELRMQDPMIRSDREVVTSQRETPAKRIRRGEKRIAGRAISDNLAVNVGYRSGAATPACGRSYPSGNGCFPSEDGLVGVENGRLKRY